MSAFAARKSARDLVLGDEKSHSVVKSEPIESDEEHDPSASPNKRRRIRRSVQNTSRSPPQERSDDHQRDLEPELDDVVRLEISPSTEDPSTQKHRYLGSYLIEILLS